MRRIKLRKPRKVGECVIVECAQSRCPEYLAGDCDKCLDMCARENWLGWNKVEYTGISLKVWEDVAPFYRTYSGYRTFYGRNYWVLVEQDGIYHAFDNQALAIGYALGRKVYYVDDVVVIGIKEEELEEFVIMTGNRCAVISQEKEGWRWRD